MPNPRVRRKTFVCEAMRTQLPDKKAKAEVDVKDSINHPQMNPVEEEMLGPIDVLGERRVQQQIATGVCPPAQSLLGTELASVHGVASRLQPRQSAPDAFASGRDEAFRLETRHADQGIIESRQLGRGGDDFEAQRARPIS